MIKGFFSSLVDIDDLLRLIVFVVLRSMEHWKKRNLFPNISSPEDFPRGNKRDRRREIPSK